MDLESTPPDPTASEHSSEQLDEVAWIVDPVLSSQRDVHGAWEQMRRVAPAMLTPHSSGDVLWSFTSHEYCREVLRDHSTLSSEDGVILSSVGIGDSAGGSTITLMDPPRHTAVRKLIRPYLGREAADRAASSMRANIEELLAPALRDDVVDVAQIFEGLSMAAFGPTIGIDREHWPVVSRAAAVSVAPHDTHFGSAATPADSLRAAHHDLFGAFRACVKQRRREPGDDIVSALIAADAAEAVPSEWHVLLNCYSIVLGAVSTTSHVATRTLLVLAERPDLWERARRDTSALPDIVEEGVRWATPTKHLVRRAIADEVIGDAPLRPGDWACAWVGSANRDESAFERPNEFVPGRSEPHLGFGFGPHMCVGMHFARVALLVLLETLVASVERLELAGTPRRLQSNWIDGLTSCPMRFHNGEGAAS